MSSSRSAIRSVAVYARLSVTKEESVSIDRQIKSATAYAESRGWTVVLVAVDDGVSAARVRPEDRVGWRQILDSREHFQAVVVWKADRLARRVLDFLHADAALQARDAGIVAVEDAIDMTTATGRALATMLAVFAEMEVEAMRVRATASREAILKSGRRAGGRPPFGWMNVANPEGPGMVLAQDPERIGYVAELAARALRGESLYSMTRWLESEGVAPRARRARGADGQAREPHPGWHEASVEAILRSPSLAGMVPFRGDLLRGADGLPIVDDSVAILSPAERRKLLVVLDSAKRPGSRQKAGHEPALLYGIVRCGSCEGLMYRATAAGKYLQYRCQQRGCPKRVGISRSALEKYVEERVLTERGDRPLVESEDVTTADNAPRLTEIEVAIAQTTAQMQDDDADDDALQERLQALKVERRAARGRGNEVRRTFKVTGRSFGAAWLRAEGDVEARRNLLLTQLDSVRIGVGGGRGRAFDAGRVGFAWREVGADERARQQYRQDVLFMRAWRD